MSDRDVISDASWERIEPLLPSMQPQRGGRWTPHRMVLEGIAWRFRTGTPWRDVPERFGSWNTLHKRHTRWADDGTYAQLHQHLLGEADRDGELDWLVSVDSTIVRAHQHASGARREDALTAAEYTGGPSNYKDRPAEPDDHALGRSRGGRTSKTHLACDGKGDGRCRWSSPPGTSTTRRCSSRC